MSKARVLILENSIAVTGALKSIVRSSMYLGEWYDIFFVLPTGSSAIADVRAQGFQCLQLPMKEIRRNIVSLVLYFPFLIINTIRFAWLLRTKRIDLVVSNDFYNMIPSLYRLCGGKVPYICYVRFMPGRFPEVLVRVWHGFHKKFARTIIAVSDAVRKELPDSIKVVVVGNELPQIEDVTLTATESKLILYPANYIKGKGHDFALECFARVSKKHPDWKLRFVGGDMGLSKNKIYKESLIRRTEQLGISNSVEWLGFTPDMMSQYRAASIVLVFSESESFSLISLEAMFYGKAVVATDCGGPSEIIDHGITGLIVPVGDIDRMTHSVDLLISDTGKRNDMAEKAYASIRVKFSNEKITDELHKIYDAVIGKLSP